MAEIAVPEQRQAAPTRAPRTDIAAMRQRRADAAKNRVSAEHQGRLSGVNSANEAESTATNRMSREAHR